MLTLPEDILNALEAGATVVVPSRQRAAALRLAYAARQSSLGKAVWNSPRVQSLGGWLQRLAEEPARGGLTPLPRILPTHEEWLLWRRAAATLLDREVPLQDSALSADSLADAFRSAAELMGRWRIAESALAGQGAEARWLGAALREVREAAAAFGAMPRADLPAALAGVARSVHGPYAEAGTLLAGVVLDRGLAPLAGTPLAGPLTRAGLGLPCTPRVEANADPAAEWRAAAEWCRRRIAEDPAARLLVVIPDLAQRRPWVERVFREVLEPASLRDACQRGEGAGSLAYAIEGGRPLADYPEPEAALQALRVLSRPCPGGDLALVLEAPWWAAADRGARARIAARLREDLPSRIPPASLGARLRALAGAGGDLAAIEPCARGIEAAVARIAAGPTASGTGPAAASHWAAVFQDALQCLGWPGDRIADSGTQQVRMQWRSLLESFAGVARMARVREAGRATELLSALARREPFAPSSGDVAVLVTAATEAPVARYDGIRVCGLQADRFPAPAQVDPFVPWALQREAGIPHASPEGQLALAVDSLEAWRRCTGELVLSWAQGEDDAHWMPSPLLAGWHDPGAARDKAQVRAVRDARAAALARSLPATLRAAVADASPLEPWADERGVPWDAGIPVPGGPGALQDQLDCPFRAYAARRLDARTEEVAEQGLSALERGRLLHLALKHFWDGVKDSRSLAALDAGGRRTRLLAAIDAAVDELRLAGDGDLLRSRLLGRERERALSLGSAALDIDAARAPFEVVLREEPIEAAIGGARVAGRVDRVDRLLADGSLAVVDYKSGTAQKLVWDGDDMTALQLWAYAALLESRGLGEVRALGNLHLTGRGVGYVAFGAAQDVLPGAEPDGWDEARADARVRLPALAEAFIAGDARVAPRAHACKHCGFAALCRLSELGVERPDDDAAKAGAA